MWNYEYLFTVKWTKWILAISAGTWLCISSVEGFVLLSWMWLWQHNMIIPTFSPWVERREPKRNPNFVIVKSRQWTTIYTRKFILSSTSLILRFFRFFASRHEILFLLVDPVRMLTQKPRTANLNLGRGDRLMCFPARHNHRFDNVPRQAASKSASFRCKIIVAYLSSIQTMCQSEAQLLFDPQLFRNCDPLYRGRMNSKTSWVGNIFCCQYSRSKVVYWYWILTGFQKDSPF